MSDELIEKRLPRGRPTTRAVLIRLMLQDETLTNDQRIQLLTELGKEEKANRIMRKQIIRDREARRKKKTLGPSFREKKVKNIDVAAVEEDILS